MKLINMPFAGDRKKLKELVDNVSTAFKIVRPEQHGLLLKFVKTKITGGHETEPLFQIVGDGIDIPCGGILGKDFLKRERPR
jgi:hypothetical protein